MFWNKRLREELAWARQELATAHHDRTLTQLLLDNAKANAEQADRALMRAHSQIDLLQAEIDVLNNRKPPSNAAVAVYSIRGFDVVQGQDGSLWARTGEGWENWSLPDTSVPEATE